ncbi:AMP-dependent synthetase [Aphanothece hegewaldii CCALA 016]|uniref:AMP-dependent synthetase n=1 Tax=Aphanothece hegewaldii CCALA 016 TaxID=2107694 RepID=A0A2T1LYU1_9CHRO|nr:fatty acyl-AMP ligase [Aphanothece hegewaldii]PSF37560.1 AMP-dependent synthetase [Aphanothece hegewaldii CCALA 016]
MYQLKQIPNHHQSESLVDLLRSRALKQPNAIAYKFLGDGENITLELSYKELDQKARSLGALYQNLGLTGKRVLLMYSPGIDFVSAFLGCLYAGVVAVPAYPPRRNQSLQRLEAIINDCQAEDVLTTSSVLQNIEHNLEQHPQLNSLRWLATDKLVNRLTTTWQPSPINKDSLAFLQYTSGSTGSPKGVMLTHGNLIHNLSLIHQNFGHNANSQGVIWLPPYHDMGLIGGVLQPLYGGFPVALMSPVDFLQKPVRWLEAISRYGGTTSGGPNFAYDLCVRKVTPEQMANLDLSSWEVAFTGAEPINPQTLEQFTDKFAEVGFRHEAFYPCYGMAESTLLVTGGNKSQAPILETVEETALAKNQVIRSIATGKGTKTLVGCGRVKADGKIAIVNPKTLTRCSANQIGEIWVSSESVAQGYWKQEQKTKEIFYANLATEKGNFLRTGDLGFLREDGELFVTGRMKNVIIIRGQNHYPQDIEQTVSQAHPALRGGCGAAFGVTINSCEKLVIVHEVERTYLKKIDPKEVTWDIRQALTAQHGLQVHDIVLLKPGSIPKTSSGKIQHFLCREKFQQGTFTPIEKSDHNEISKISKVKSTWTLAPAI